jgi:glycerol-3-phosphate dehydrogenase
LAGASNGKILDLAIIGGGINGCGIARDAAGRGLSVALCEQGDLAGATSSASTKLIHGGLRYLEHCAFRLVREALMEREVLLAAAPHIIRPLRFVLPHHEGLRPRWMLRAGLFLYDAIGGRRTLPGTRTLDLSHDPAGTPLKPEMRHAFEYSDAWVDDARLVVLNARDAAERGAEILTRSRCSAAVAAADHWRLTITAPSGQRTLRARVLVNAAGPWVADVLHAVVGCPSAPPVRQVKGSHIVVPRHFDHDRAYIFQNRDRRVCFAIPYEQDFTLIGTTDEDFTGDPAHVAISQAETRYLLDAVNAYFRIPVAADTIRWCYAGVRPLYDDGASAAQEATRDYVLKLESGDRSPAILSVFGGKITTYRRLAEQALEDLRPHLPAMGHPWTRGQSLPGGDLALADVPRAIEDLARRHPYLPAGAAPRLLRAYGTRSERILAGARAMADLGHHFGAGLTEREVAYLMAEEWAQTAADVVWRRSKLGLRMRAAEVAALDTWMHTRRPA